MSDEQLDRLQRVWQARRESSRDDMACPGADAIFEAAIGAASPEQVHALAAHMVTCPGCAEAWRAAHRMAGLEERPRRSFWLSGRPAGRLARAAVVLAVAGAAVVAAMTHWSTGVSDNARLRRDAPTRVRSLVDEEVALPRGAARLAWTPGPPGSVYNVRVSTDAFVPVTAVQGLEEAELLLPAAALGDLKSGARLLWQVEAFFPNGDRVVSDTFIAVLE